MNTPKELLSQHVEEIFKSYTTPGLHICDIATGGGKSYTIGKLTCQYWSDGYFDRIVILCVQNKLVKAMNDEIERFINAEGSLITMSDKVVIENNAEVIASALANGSLKELLEEINHRIDEDGKKSEVRKLRSCYNKIKKLFDALCGLDKARKEANNDYLKNEIEKNEYYLRNEIRTFFDLYRHHLEDTGQRKKVTTDYIIKTFPALSTVYPQTDCMSKKVLLMTVHKAMYGIDPILSERVSLTNFSDKKKTLIIFDESDQAATAIRSTIMDMAIEASGGSSRFAKGYKGYLQYRNLIGNPEQVATRYHGEDLFKSLQQAIVSTTKRWQKTMDMVEAYNNIFLSEEDDIEDFRRGVFFSGPAFRLNVCAKEAKNSYSFICHKKGEKHLTLVHSVNEEPLKKEYELVVPLVDFLNMNLVNLTTIKTHLREVVMAALNKSRDKFREENVNSGLDSTGGNRFMGWPTIEREIHTLMVRFEPTSEYQFEKQLLDFITTRKNVLVKIGDETVKVLDNSVYSQGFQLFQEEIDDRDNQFRVCLSCREIQDTPEKILVDLTNSENTSVVLCSATAAGRSVVNNCDIKYLEQTLGPKMQYLSKKDIQSFDELSYATYPQEHEVKVMRIDEFVPADARVQHLALPEKYRNLFCKEAIEDGLVDKWFSCTRRWLIANSKTDKDVVFHMNRLLQFAEVYHAFINQEDVHSMIYFQNKTGDKDSMQYNIIACLVDGSYKGIPNATIDGDLPMDWANPHLCFTKDWEVVENEILSKLGQDKDAKLMLVAAYGSFKAGANMQYVIPEGLGNLVRGDSWTSDEAPRKDWDAIFLQAPTSYLTMAEDYTEQTFEKSLYNAMLTLMMLYERGYLSKQEVNRWLVSAMSGNLKFSDKNNAGITMDKSSWALTIMEQAVGRLCRTRNKNKTTYIMYDALAENFFECVNHDKSMTKEFKALVDYVTTHIVPSGVVKSADEVRLCNDARTAQEAIRRMLSIALKYTVKSAPDEADDIEDDVNPNEESVPFMVGQHQRMNQSFKHTIISKPVLGDQNELSNSDRLCNFIWKCYGEWPRTEGESGYCFNYSAKDKSISVGAQHHISPKDVRLDVLMSNNVIRSHFETHGFATDWKPGKYILHPQILRESYCGEIGEEAFKAILLHYTDCTEDDIKHLEGRNYELADFVICNADGTNRIAFDVKNMNPKANHDDRVQDMPTAEKRRKKEERLGCKLITINVLKIEEGIDPTREIYGLIDLEGRVLPESIDQLKILVNNEKTN